jgi:hypothetical protein
MGYEAFPDLPTDPSTTWLWVCAVVCLMALPILVSARSKARRRALETSVFPAVHGGPGHSDEDPIAFHEVSYRREGWTTADGREVVMLMVAANGICAVHALIAAPDGPTLRAGRDIFAMGAFASDRDAVLEALPTGPANPGFLKLMGLFGSNDEFLAGVRDLAHILVTASANWTVFADVSRLFIPTFEQAPGSETGHSVMLGKDEVRLSDICYLVTDILPAPVPAAGTGIESLTMADPRSPDADAAAELASLSAFMGDWHARAVALARPGMLEASGWSQETYAYLKVEPSLRLRRSQAMALQKALSPMLVRNPDLWHAIDAGLPFEGILMDEVNAYSPWTSIRPLDKARMKRLRAYPSTPYVLGTHPDARRGGSLEWKSLAGVLWAATAFPLDRVPSTSAGWSKVVPEVVGTLTLVRRWGLSLDDVLSGLPREWGLEDLAGHYATDEDRTKEPALPQRHRNPDGRSHPIDRHLIGVGDMLARFVSTVLAPSGIPVPDFRDRGGTCSETSMTKAPNATEAMAARMLFDGRSFKGILKLQEEWHARLSEFDRALPPQPGGDEFEWPALFQPRVFAGDISVRCLTTSAELRDEGKRGEDRFGVPGLSHCVGGFGSRCAEGRSHIVSIRGPEKDGVRLRLSTVEITFEHPPVHVRQHHGLNNGPPPRAAEKAFEQLLVLMRNGQVVMDPEALEPRVPKPLPKHGYDLPGAVTAWLPYLTPLGRKECKALVAAYGTPPAAPVS